VARSETVRSSTAVDTWTSFVKAAMGALGFGLLAVGPLVPRHTAFPALPIYAFAAGGLLVLLAATMRLRSMLIVLACIGLSAALACTLASAQQPLLNESALALYCGSAVVVGAIGRRFWMALPFLIVPILLVVPTGAAWSSSHEAAAAAWHQALDCDCLWAGLPAALAIVGAVVGEFRVNPWPAVRPSALPVLVAAAGLLMAGLIVASVLPDSFAFARTTCLRVALLAGVLGWVALAYQVGRRSFVWDAALACLLVLGGALYVDPDTRYPDSFDTAMVVTVLASLVPAALAGFGLLVRKWIGTERPTAGGGPRPTATGTAASPLPSDFSAAMPPPAEFAKPAARDPVLPPVAPPPPAGPPRPPSPPSPP
jgi:hypothetical protein